MAERPGSRPRSRRPRRRPPDPARLAAHEVLTAVRVEDAYTNLVLPGVLRRHGLTGRDAAFATELAAGTVRRRGTYDAVLAACIDRPLRKVEVRVLDALRLGAHQLLAMRVPDHAAISTTVDLVAAVTPGPGGEGAAGFANAVLRRVAGADLDGWVSRLAPDPAADLVRWGELAHSHPAWVVAELRRVVGDDELPALLAADNLSPAVTLVARPGRSEPAELLAEPGSTAGRWSPYAVTRAGGDPTDVTAVAEGRAGVQDEGSQLVALALADAPLAGPDRAWLDLCAGPGGKSALLAAVAAGRGAAVVSAELQHHRARLVARSLAGGAGSAGVVTADGAHPPFRAASFDRVLVDAPCTGLGALRRRPEARWRRRPDDLVALVLLQRRLLASALELVRPGGVVLYATCSPVWGETADVVTSMLQQRPDVALAEIGGAVAGVPDRDGPLAGTVQLWPHRHGTDAMFLALLTRT